MFLVLILIVIGGIIASRLWLDRTFDTTSRRASECGMSGAEVAERVLAAAGVDGVSVELVDGDDEWLGQYNPRTRTIRLGPNSHNSASVAAAAVAAHEAGHAIQHAEGQRSFRVRSALAPAAITASSVWPLLLLVGLMSGLTGFWALGIALYAIAVLFEFTVLPVEFDASRRAYRLLEAEVLPRRELCDARSVLRAAALTYMVATAAGFLQLIWLLCDGDD